MVAISGARKLTLPSRTTSKPTSAPTKKWKPSKKPILSYVKYIRSGQWFRRRADFLKKHPNCLICDSLEDQTVHHVRYRDDKGVSILGREKDSDLRTLCSKCHDKIHFYKLESIFNVADFEKQKELVLKLEAVSTHDSQSQSVIFTSPDIDIPW